MRHIFDDPEIVNLLNAFDKLRVARQNVQYGGSYVMKKRRSASGWLIRALALARQRFG
ncbi:MAG: hypothetical protein WBJ06_02885 [Candidatus Methanoculleus thermohydrogenotrophicum]|uniref:hypothetical protein n=1 Tax=Methanoculleus thermophilus TaxID=2200 RepID=UPI001379CDE0|nr:hypothetical protein [Methanoculleus thermophilus]MDD4568261.1 hypothetical protein [Methanoculleus chikugoensis]